MREIWFAVQDCFQLLDVCGPLQVFATANDELAAEGRAPVYRLEVRALRPGSVLSSSGVALLARALPRRLKRTIDTVILPGGPGVWRPGGAAAGMADGVADWLRCAAPRIGRIASVCTGAFTLARSGLFGDALVVTHWAACASLASAFPGLQVQQNAIYFRHGRCWSSAGVTAGIDMALAMVEADVGNSIAMAVAKKLVVFYKRPGGQAQFSSALLEQSAGDPRIAGLHRWIAQHLREDLDVARMAGQLAMTPRTFARFYLRQTGTTPARGVARIRLDHACKLVEATSQSLKAVAQVCGYGSEENLRRAFVRELHVSPIDYRGRFSASAREVDP